VARNLAAAQREDEVLNGITVLRAGTIGPVDIGCPKAASADVDTEVGVTAASQVVKDDPDGRIGTPSRLTERHGDVEAMDDNVAERAMEPAAGRDPAVKRLGTQICDELFLGQLSVASRDAVGQAREIELAVTQFGHKGGLVIVGRHGQVGHHLSNAPPLAERCAVPTV
jgi:hypothetical protein